MKTLTLALIALGLGLAHTATAAANALNEITLTDGRVLHDVSVKTFDPASGKFHLIADGKAQLIPASLFPPALAADLQKTARQPGSSTNVVKSTDLSEAERARILSLRASAAERHAHELATIAATPTPAPATVTRPVIYRYYPSYNSGYNYDCNSACYHWRDCREQRLDDDYRRRTQQPTTITPTLEPNALPSGPVRVITNRPLSRI